MAYEARPADRLIQRPAADLLNPRVNSDDRTREWRIFCASFR
jgi:hypothetical protein